MKKIRICVFVLSVVFVTALPAQQGSGSKEFAIGIGFPVMIPVGDFRDVSTLSFGNSLEARLAGLIEPVELRFKAEYYYFSSTRNITTAYQAVSAVLYGGYPFPLIRRVSLTPLVGLGVLYHLTEDIFYDGPHGYTDIFAKVGVGIDFFILEYLSLNAVPEYTVFFEEDCCGMFFGIDLGASYHF